MYKTTVIIPVFNECETITRTLSAVCDFAKANPDYYFLFVNDGSKDNTAEIIRNNIIGIPNISFLDLKKNKGKATALKSAVDILDTDYICFTDGDLAYSLNHLFLLVEALENNEVVIGNRNLGEKNIRNIKRIIAGEAFNRMVRVILNLNITDTQAGIKGFRKEAAKELFTLNRIKNFAFDAELLYVAKLKGYRIGQIPAKVNEFHQKRPSTVKVFYHSPIMFVSLFKIIFNRIIGRYGK